MIRLKENLSFEDLEKYKKLSSLLKHKFKIDTENQKKEIMKEDDNKSQ